ERHRQLRGRVQRHRRLADRELPVEPAHGLDVLRLHLQRAQHPARLRAPDRRPGVPQQSRGGTPPELGPAEGRLPVTAMRLATLDAETTMTRWLTIACTALSLAGAAWPAPSACPAPD